MGFTRTRAADEYRVAFGVEKGARGEFAHESFVDRRVGEDKLVDILENGEPGASDAIADGTGLPMRALGADQAAMSG
jgi:hypothetical protein